MKRLLTISNPIWADETLALTIVEVDHFLNRVDAIEWSLVLIDGVGEVELPALKLGSQNFYYILEKKHIFTLWDNDMAPMLLDDTSFRRIYPVMNGSSDDDEMDVLNFNCLLNRYLNGEPITSKEDERILCDFFNFADGSQSTDERMCEIDKGLVNAS